MARFLFKENMKKSITEEIPVKNFISDILPTATGLEVLLENKHAPNMVSLIAPENKEAPSMFKWDNGFSWAYALQQRKQSCCHKS